MTFPTTDALVMTLGRVGIVLLLAFVLTRFTKSVIRRTIHRVADGSGPGGDERQKRAQTLGATLHRAVTVLTWGTAGLEVLREIGVDITPVLTGAGILGLAVGFGSQALVKDVISGIFLIVEDQIRVGDAAVVNGIKGSVEEINLRTIVLRDDEGAVHTIPNGEIRTMTNRSKDYAYYMIDLGISDEEDTDLVVDAVRAAADDLMRDAAFAANILEPLETLGVDDFKASQVTLKFRIKTLPLKQWEVGRELRRRIKKTLDARGLKTPVPKLDVTVTNTDRRAPL